MESPELTKEQLMNIGWDHCRKLGKVLNANDKIAAMLKKKPSAEVVYQDPDQTPLTEEQDLFKMHQTWKWRMDIPGGINRDSFGHGYYSEFFLSAYLGNYLDFIRIISKMGKKELDQQLQSREGFFHLSPLAASILGTINLCQDFDAPWPVATDHTREGITKLFPNRKMQQNQIWEKLIDVGADVNAHDLTGATPLHYVVKNGASCCHWIQLAKLLLKKGAEINGVDRYGMTPLAYAVFIQSLSYVKFLISQGADPFVKYSNRKNEVPVEDGSILQYAMDPNSFSAEMVVALLEGTPQKERKLNCQVCGEKTKRKCSACKAVWYCSQNCLKTDRSGHMKLCNKVKEEHWKQAGLD